MVFFSSPYTFVLPIYVFLCFTSGCHISHGLPLKTFPSTSAFKYVGYLLLFLYFWMWGGVKTPQTKKNQKKLTADYPTDYFPVFYF